MARGLARALAGAFRDPTVCWGGGAYRPNANSRAQGRRKACEAAIERSQRELSDAYLNIFLKGYGSGQIRVKGQNNSYVHP